MKVANCGVVVAGIMAPALMALMSPAAGAAAQLRPIGPLDWSTLGEERTFTAAIGVGYLVDQRASLAGTRGNLLEVGNFHVGLRADRIGLEFSGTLVRRFADRDILLPPAPGANPPTGQPRQDAGDVIASTAIRLINRPGPFGLALRFGTRLPTTSNELGLDRDRTDFFSSLGSRLDAGAVTVSVELGVAILGTRTDYVDQRDVLMYSAGLESDLGPVRASGLVVGQNDGGRDPIRGNEDLSEIRLGLRTGDRSWVSASFVVGLTDFSPDSGILVMAGIRR